MTQLTTVSADDPAAGKLAGRLTMLLVALLWSTSGLFAKAPIFDAWPEAYRGSLLAFWRSACAALVLLPTIRRPRYRTYLIPLTICFALMNVTYLTSMTRSTAANAIWLQNMAPWWVFLLSVLLFHEPVVRRDLIPLAFAMLGVGTILSFEIRGQAPFGAICGAASGVFYAAVVVLMRQLRSENSSWIVALSHTVTAAVLLPWVRSDRLCAILRATTGPRRFRHRADGDPLPAAHPRTPFDQQSGSRCHRPRRAGPATPLGMADLGARSLPGGPSSVPPSSSPASSSATSSANSSSPAKPHRIRGPKLPSPACGRGAGGEGAFHPSHLPPHTTHHTLPTTRRQ